MPRRDMKEEVRETRKKRYEIKKSASRDDILLCQHGKRVHRKSSGDKSVDPAVAAATANLLTPMSSVSSCSSSSLGAVASRRRDITKSAPAPSQPLQEVKQNFEHEKKAGSLQRIRSDLHALGVRTTNHVSFSRQLNVFDDHCWEQYGKSGDVLIFDLTSQEEVVCKKQTKTLACEEMMQDQKTPYPWRGRGRYNAEWSIKPTEKEYRPRAVGQFEGGLYCRRLYNTKVQSSHTDKYKAFKVGERTQNPNMQELIMNLGGTPDTDPSDRDIYKNGKPDFYHDVDELHEYLEEYKLNEKPGEHLVTPPTNPYFKEEEKAAIYCNDDAREVDPQSCWPCVGCQDDEVPKSARWCSVI